MKTLIKTVAAATALCAAAMAPAYAQNVNVSGEGLYGRVSFETGFEPDPYMVTVLAGGPVDSSNVDESCVGMLSQRASFTLNFRGGSELPLIISATSDGDATIAVRAPNGQWSCNDDTDGLNPAVRFDSPRNGRYQIWVGNLSSSDAMPAMLYISEVVTGGSMSSAMGSAPPDFTLDPAYGAIDLASGFEPDPHTQQIAAGGGYDATGLNTAGCVGWIATAPDYRVNFTAGNYGLPLIFSVAAEADTTLVINDAGGNWVCNDDSNGLNPAIRFDNPQSGQYDVWVGTFAQGDLQDSTLSVSELEN